jgi:predicted patatin/cPLA2 family phospholipase
MINKAGLVLEGGAVRGLFTAGALDYLMEQDMYFEYVVSVSAGTCCALGYIAKQKGRTKACLFPDKKDEWIGKSLIKKGKGVMDIDKAFYEFPYKQFPLRFDKYFGSGIKNEIVVTNLNTGKAEYLTEKGNEKKLLDISAASCSLPLIAKSVDLGGNKYYDGGIGDSLPYKRALSQGYDKIFVIQTRPLDKAPSSPKAMEAVYKVRFAKNKEFLSTLLNRPLTYKAQADKLSALEKRGKAFVLRPTLPEIDRMETDFNKKMEFYNHGYERMKSKYQELLKYINS